MPQTRSVHKTNYLFYYHNIRKQGEDKTRTKVPVFALELPCKRGIYQNSLSRHMQHSRYYPYHGKPMDHTPPKSKLRASTYMSVLCTCRMLHNFEPIAHMMDWVYKRRQAFARQEDLTAVLSVYSDRRKRHSLQCFPLLCLPVFQNTLEKQPFD